MSNLIKKNSTFSETSSRKSGDDGSGLFPDGVAQSDEPMDESSAEVQVPSTSRRRFIRWVGAFALLSAVISGVTVAVIKTRGDDASSPQESVTQKDATSSSTFTFTGTLVGTTPVDPSPVPVPEPAEPAPASAPEPVVDPIPEPDSIPAPETVPAPAPTTDQQQQETETATSTVCDITKAIPTDVLIIGAGVAGISAAKQINQESGGTLDVTVVESRTDLGGRVQTEDFGNYKLQRGATWLNPGNPITDQYEASGLYKAPDNFMNASIYEYWCDQTGGRRHLRGQEQQDGHLESRKIDQGKLEAILERLDQDLSLEPEKKTLARRFLKRLAEDDTKERNLLNGQCSCSKVSSEEWNAAVSNWKSEVLPCVEEKVDMFWCEEFDPEEDIGLLAEYAACNWNGQDPLEFAVKYLWHDWEYATDSGSMFSWFDPYGGQDFYLAADDWAQSLRDMASASNVQPIYDQRVRKVEYNVFDNDSGVRARVHAVDSAGICTVYSAQRVISTVSVGVYNNNLIQFDPPLLYPEATYNPLKIQNYVKIFYQFPTKFWGTENQDHYIMTLKSQNPDGVSLHWQNYDRNGLYPGSGILLLTLVGQDFEKAVGAGNVRNEEIDESVLMDLLEPLRVAFPDDFVEPDNWYHNKFHADPDFGFGAYSQWVEGYSPEDYFHFWGAYDFNDYVDECDHNGCNSDEEWILYLSGTNACMDDFEFVHSGYYGGYFSANLMLQSLGYDLKFKDFDKCYS